MNVGHKQTDTIFSDELARKWNPAKGLKMRNPPRKMKEGELKRASRRAFPD
jgi:hypothetical protein